MNRNSCPILLSQMARTGLLQFLFLSTPLHSPWSSCILLIVRLLTLSVILRTYIVPWSLRLLFQHFRVRSVSLRSIRGIYLRHGRKTWHIDRIGLSYHRSRLTLKVEGLTLEIVKRSEEPQDPTAHTEMRRRRPILADLAPSPLAYRLRSVLFALYAALEPYFRPLVRSSFVFASRLLIRCIPALTQVFDFEIDSAILKLEDLPGTVFSSSEIFISTKVVLSQIEKMTVTEMSSLQRPRNRFLSMIDWRSRLTSNIQRTWARAWGTTRGTVSVSFRFGDLSAMSSVVHNQNYIFKIPSSQIVASVDINSSRGVEPHSLVATVNLDSVNVLVNLLSSVVDVLQSRKSDVHPNHDRTYSQEPPTSLIWSPISPTTPSMNVFSRAAASSYRLADSRKMLNATGASLLLSYIKTISFQLSDINLEFGSADCQTSSHMLNLRKSSVLVGFSNTDSNVMHRDILGRSGHADELDQDVYMAECSVEQVTFERISPGLHPHSTTLATIGFIHLSALATQWPALWMNSNSFMSGDANAALLAIRLKVTQVDITQDWESIQGALRFTSSSTDISPSTTLLPPVLTSVPRISLDVEVGKIRATCPCSAVGNQVVEMNTNGLALSMSSHFSGDASRLRSQDMESLPYDQLPVRMLTKVLFATEPIEIGVKCSPCTQILVPTSSSDTIAVTLETTSEPMLTIDAVELIGSGATLASVSDLSVVSLDVPSTFVEFHCVTDALSVELWHPGVISAISSLVDLVTSKSRSSKFPRTLSWADQIFPGWCLSLAVARFTIFVTSPDFNPREEMDISRGIAFRSGIALEHCAILPLHIASIGDVSVRAHTRQKLHLSEERIMDAIYEARCAQDPYRTSNLGRISLWDTGIRSAIATPFVADDPYSMKESSFAEENREFLFIPHTHIDLTFPGGHADLLDRNYECFVDITSIRCKLELVHAYSLLLAAQTLKSLSTSNQHSKRSLQSYKNESETVLLSLRLTVHTLELLCRFPIKQSIYTRINDLTVRLSPNQDLRLHWDTWVFWVPRPRRKDENDVEDLKWEEFSCLQNWNVDVERTNGSTSVGIKGDTGRLRIPHQFILSELVLSIVMTMKCVRHLIQLMPAMKFAEMSSPCAEGPKIVPKISAEICHLTAEAADDPFESKLGLISHAGLRALEIMRTHRDAFDAKVAAIMVAEISSVNESGFTDASEGYKFSSKHSVTIEEARQRLLHVHAKTWREVHKVYRQKQDVYERTASPRRSSRLHLSEVPMINVSQMPPGPPLLKFMIENLHICICAPSFSLPELPDFLYEQGSGEPRDTQYYLLVPLHLSLSMTSIQATLRDYPLPLLSIHASSTQEGPTLTFDSDLVIAEEVGTLHSVEWRDCVVVEQHYGIQGASPFSIDVPKTIMPVKTFANPVIRLLTREVTDICWSVSYSPAIQDVMRVVESLSSAPRDSSPPVGFWDKIRLAFHWKILASFTGDIHLHMKGSRDPYTVLYNGAGFALCWSGNPKIMIGEPNEDGEQIQVISDTMSITIPNFEGLHEFSEPSVSAFDSLESKEKLAPANTRFCEFRKTCAKLGSGVRFGVRFDLERTCDSNCQQCSGPAHRRRCRIFKFSPHYDVKLEQNSNRAAGRALIDSYHGFRSDFIHMSISLTSAVRHTRGLAQDSFSSFHLTPQVFAQFWHWWGLFDGRLSLPIRQGSYYRHRIVSPKFGHHLATIKYRISVPHLFISHAYIDESRQAWSDGITRFVGVKALIDHFHADMHQRDQESTQFNQSLGTTEVVRHKPFNAIEVVLKGLDLRALLATFSDPVKKIVLPEPCPGMSEDRIRNDLPAADPGSIWIDEDDFVEVDWRSSDVPEVNLLRLAACPHFAYFKRSVEPGDREPSKRTEFSKFGNEDTHVCMVGKEPTTLQIQIDLVALRIEELKGMLSKGSADISVERMIDLLENYISLLRRSDTSDRTTYYMSTDTISESEWLSFDNVYHVHCLKLFLNESVRDVMLTYYYCSRSRRGFEYHLATRAVKFIRDQDLLRDFGVDSTEQQPSKGTASVAQAAVQALRKSFNLEYDTGVDTDVSFDNELPSGFNPLEGWSQGISLRRSHFCVLLKPQIVFNSEISAEAVCVLAAGLAKLQMNEIIDDSNVDDPVCGKIMSRTHSTLDGLQIFSPSTASLSADGCVPVEVMIDFRGESLDFDRIVPQTEAVIRYDKFNRLRLRNKITSLVNVGLAPGDSTHLQHQTDLFSVHVPRFTVSATDSHFAAISDIVNNLLLFSDSAHKTRLERVGTLLFSYDFTDCASSANVVSGLQAKLREAVEQEQAAQWRLRRIAPSESQFKLEMAKIKADVLALADELGYVFEAIKLAQDTMEGNSDQKSALLLLAYSKEMSWRMLDASRDLLAKLSVKEVKFSWLNRQDSSTMNKLKVGDLRAFDGSADAIWSEILCKHSEPSNHPLIKRDLFAVSNWTVLAPVGGISIYENFDVLLHPIRLQLDTKVGEMIMEYIWPARKHRRAVKNKNLDLNQQQPSKNASTPSPRAEETWTRRSSLDVLSSQHHKFPGSPLPFPEPIRRLGTSRSFSDLRSATLSASTSHNNGSTDLLWLPSPSSADTLFSPKRKGTAAAYLPVRRDETNDAAEMRTRSSQKTFVSVDIASIHLLLSIMKEGSFLCNDARISTRDLQYRNQVWSIEELVDQFIPSDPSWKGWLKMAFHQPFFEVFPVARELISKTRRITAKGRTRVDVSSHSTKKGSKPPKSEGRHGEIRPLTRTVRITESDLTGPNSMLYARELEPSVHFRPRVLSLFRRNMHGQSNLASTSDPQIGPS